MFDIGWGELIVIGVVALIAIGPKELPTVLRTVGQWMGKVRRMASEFQGQFQEAMREAEFAELKKQVDGIGEGASFNPLETARQELERAMDDKPRPADEPPPAPAPAPDYTAADVAAPADTAAASIPAAADAPPVPPVAVEPQPSPSEPRAAEGEKDFNPDQPGPPVPQGGGGRGA